MNVLQLGPLTFLNHMMPILSMCFKVGATPALQALSSDEMADVAILSSPEFHEPSYALEHVVQSMSAPVKAPCQAILSCMGVPSAVFV
jgi:hypothetical protein